MLDFLERTPLRDSMRAFEPGFWKSLAALKKFLFELLAAGIATLGYALRTNPSK